MAATLRDVEALGATHPLLDTREYDSYSWTLFEDHPLRSYPAECPSWGAPNKFRHTRERRWKETLTPIACLLLMFFVVAQFLSQLPQIASYVLQPVPDKRLTEFIQWSAAHESDIHPSTACANLPAVDVIESVITNGCTSIVVDLCLQGQDLLVGSSPSSLDEGRTLQSVYLQPLLNQLTIRNFAAMGVKNESNTLPIGLFDTHPEQSFTLYLQLRSPMRAVLPYLISQLEELGDSGYLSYNNLTAENEYRVVTRPVTIVVLGREKRRLKHSLIHWLRQTFEEIF